MGSALASAWSMWSLVLALALMGKLPAASHRHHPLASAAKALHAEPVPGTVSAWHCSWSELEPSVLCTKAGPSPGLGPTGNLRWVCRHCSAVRAQPEFPASLMEICTSESQRVAPKFLEVDQDMAEFHTQ